MFLLFELEISSFNISLEISSCYFSSWKFPVFIFLLAGDFQCQYLTEISSFNISLEISSRYVSSWRFPVFFLSNWRFPVSIFHLTISGFTFRTGDFQFNISLEISSYYLSSWKFPVFIFLLTGDFQCLYFRYFQFLFFRYFQCQDFGYFSNWSFLVSRFHLRFPVSIFRFGDFQFFFGELEISNFYL